MGAMEIGFWHSSNTDANSHRYANRRHTNAIGIGLPKLANLDASSCRIHLRGD